MKVNIKFDMDSAALFIAVLAVLMTFWQGYETRQHNRKSVIPVLDISQSSDLNRDESKYSLAIGNVGLGPAKVYGTKIFFDGEQETSLIESGHQTAFNKTFDAVNTYLRSLELNQFQRRTLVSSDSTIEVGDLIPAGQVQNILGFEGVMELDEFRGLMSIVEDRLDISVCYCSIYDDQCQKVHFGNQPTLTDESCEVKKNGS